MSTFDPPIVRRDARLQLAGDILKDHTARPSTLWPRWLWTWLRGWRCAGPYCGLRWPCPPAEWAERERRRPPAPTGRVYVSTRAAE